MVEMVGVADGVYVGTVGDNDGKKVLYSHILLAECAQSLSHCVLQQNSSFPHTLA